MKKFDIFLSHSSRDKPWANRLASSLKKQGVEVWLDEEQVRPGENMVEAIQKGITQSKLVVTVIDPKAVSRSNVFLEAGMAVGLGKDVTFVIPEEEITSGRFPVDLAKSKVLIRRSPTATARELITTKMIKDEVSDSNFVVIKNE